MAEKFDPDKYLQETETFNPDDYLASTSEEISGLESAIRGAAQEASFGLADELAGLAETGLETAKGNVPLSASELLKAYQRLRDESRQAYKAAEEANPKTYLAGQVAGGLLPAYLTGGTTVAGKLAAGAATKAGIGQLMKEGAKSGLKYGLAAAPGKSEAELADREFGQLAKDIASEGVIGGVAGGAMPLAVPVVKGAGRLAKEGIEKGLEMVPGYEAMKTGFELGKEGIVASAKSLGAEYKKIAEEVTQKIKTKLQAAGVSKAEALELADQMNISMNAGDDVQTAIEKASRSVGVDENQKRQYIEFLKRTAGEDVDLAKATQQLEQKRAVAIEKASREGKQLQTTTEINKDVGEVLIEPELKGRVVGFQDKLVKVGADGKSKTSKLVTLKTVKDPDIPVTARDIENLSPTEMADFLKDINRFTGNLNKQAQNDVERNARQLASQINEKLNTALQGTDLAPLNNEMANLFNAIKNLKMPGNVTTKNRMLVDEQIAQVQKKLMDISDKGAVDKELIFKRLAEASPEFTADKNLIKLLDDYKKIAEKGTGAGGFGLEALLGSAQRRVTTAANIAGRATRALPEVSKKITDASPEFVKNLAVSVQANPKFQAFAPALQTAATATTEASRKAAMFALYQQPAFREMVKQMSGLEGATQKALEEYTPRINPPINPDSPQRSPSFNLPTETEEEEEGYTEITPELQKIMDDENRKTVKSGGWNESKNRWFPHKSIEKGADTLAYGIKLIPGRFTAQELKRFYNEGISDDEAKGLFLNHLNEAKRDADDIQRKYNIPPMTPDQKLALTEMVYQMGKTKIIGGVVDGKRTKGFPNMLKALKRGDWESAKYHALDSNWATKQTPGRANNVASRLVPKPATSQSTQNGNQASTQDVSGLLEKFAGIAGKGLRSLSNAIIPEAAAAADMPFIQQAMKANIDPNDPEAVTSAYKMLLGKEGVEGDKLSNTPTGAIGVTEAARRQMKKQDDYEKANTAEEKQKIDLEVAKDYLKYLYEQGKKNNLDKLSPTQQRVLLYRAYNQGPRFLKGDAIEFAADDKPAEAAEALLEYANVNSKLSKGIAKSLAQDYNKIKTEDQKEIAFVRQKENSIEYLDKDGNVIKTLVGTKHPKNTLGTIDVNTERPVKPQELNAAKEVIPQLKLERKNTV